MTQSPGSRHSGPRLARHTKALPGHELQKATRAPEVWVRDGAGPRRSAPPATELPPPWACRPVPTGVWEHHSMLVPSSLLTEAPAQTATQQSPTPRTGAGRPALKRPPTQLLRTKLDARLLITPCLTRIVSNVTSLEPRAVPGCTPPSAGFHLGQFRGTPPGPTGPLRPGRGPRLPPRDGMGSGQVWQSRGRRPSSHVTTRVIT